MNWKIRDNIYPDDYDYLMEYSMLLTIMEKEIAELMPTGVVHHIDITSSIAKNIDHQLKLTFEEVKDLYLIGCIIPRFAPREERLLSHRCSKK